MDIKSEYEANALQKQLFVDANTFNHQWVEKDVKPLKIESYTSSPENYIDKIEFQLSGTYNGEDKSAVANTWQAACKEFLEKDNFHRRDSVSTFVHLQ